MDNWNPAQYDKFKDQRAKPFFDLLDMIYPVTDPQIVDLGCGTGELTRHLHEHLNAKFTFGIDSSTNMLEKAKLYSSDDLKFEHQNIKEFYPTKRFDVVFSNAALQWVEDHETLLPKIFNWAKSDGQVAIQVPYNFDHPSHRIAADVALRLFPHKFNNRPRKTNVLSVERYADLFFRNGFVQQDCLIRVYGHPMPSGSEVIEWTKGTLLTSYQSQLSGDEFDKFLKEYSRELISLIGDGPYFYGFKRMLLWGKRK